MTTVGVTYDCCNRTYELPAAMPEQGSALRHAAAVDTVVLLTDVLHEKECGR